MQRDELSVGKKWTTSAIQTNEGGQGQYTANIKIVALEKITVPAGEFLAYKFEATGWSNNARFKDTYWCEPNWGVRIKWIRVLDRRKEKVRETYELQSVSRGPQSGS